jgi:hypothetical protein
VQRAYALRVAAMAIAAIFAGFLNEQRQRLSPQTFLRYDEVINLLSSCLTTEEGAQGTDQAGLTSTETSGVKKLISSIPEFLDYFMIRKVMASEETLKIAGVVVCRLIDWLEENRLIDAATAIEATHSARQTRRNLPRAQRISALLAEQANDDKTLMLKVLRSVPQPRVPFAEDYLTVTAVNDSQLWFAEVAGPLPVSVEVASLIQPGWQINLAMHFYDGRWWLGEVGHCYPKPVY